MGYDWKHYLKFSEMLFRAPISCGDGAVPVTSYRVILSRVYYAAFHVAQDFLIAHKLPVPEFGAEHEKIIQAYKQMVKKDTAFQTECKKIGEKLRRLKIARVDADYETEYSPTNAFVQVQIKDSQNVVASLAQLENTYFSKK